MDFVNEKILNSIKKRTCIYYNPNYACNSTTLSLGDALKITSGSVNSLCTSYLKAIGYYGFGYHFTSNPENLVIDETIFNKEITKELNSDYITEINLKSSIFNTLSNGIYNYKQIRDSCDELPVHLAEKLDGVVFCADYYEAAYARFYNVPFVFLFLESEKQIKIFWEKMQRLCYLIHLTMSKKYENI